MSSITPLRRSRTTEAEARLLRSTRLDVPPRGAKGRLLGALGLGVCRAFCESKKSRQPPS